MTAVRHPRLTSQPLAAWGAAGGDDSGAAGGDDSGAAGGDDEDGGRTAQAEAASRATRSNRLR